MVSAGIWYALKNRLYCLSSANAKMAGLSDGAIVGSAIIRIIEKYGREAAGPVGEYIREMKEAVMREC